MKFDGNSWINVGTAGFSSYEVIFTSLAFNPIGQPYVAYSDYGNNNKATVMKFDGINWITVGNSGFSAGIAQWTSLAFNPSGRPYVAYSDIANFGKATAMYFNAPTGINEIQESRLSLYPNPAIDKITIKTSSTSTSSHVTIMNLNGQKLITRQITKPKTQLDISNLPSGVYFVRITSERKMEAGKIIKQ